MHKNLFIIFLYTFSSMHTEEIELTELKIKDELYKGYALMFLFITIQARRFDATTRRFPSILPEAESCN